MTKDLRVQAFATRPERFELPTFGSVDARTHLAVPLRVGIGASSTSLDPLTWIAH
jgi:hypothetical protein